MAAARRSGSTVRAAAWSADRSRARTDWRWATESGIPRSATEELLGPALVVAGSGDAPHRLGGSDALKLAGRRTFAQRLQRVVDRLHRGRERLMSLQRDAHAPAR